MSKACSKCKTIKPVTGFYSNIKSKDGLDSWCRTCKMAYIRYFQRENADRTAENKRNYVVRNPDKVKETKAAYRRKNRELLREKGRKYVRDNKKAALARCRAYQSSKKLSVPVWVSNGHRKQIEAFYKNCPTGHHVDHIVPLRGKNVSGFHVIWNLQYLPASENLRKSNKH